MRICEIDEQHPNQNLVDTIDQLAYVCGGIFHKFTIPEVMNNEYYR
jgi:hypothetical protein